MPRHNLRVVRVCTPAACLIVDSSAYARAFPASTFFATLGGAVRDHAQVVPTKGVPSDAVRFATIPARQAPLPRRVAHVGEVVALKKMIGAHAKRIIAVVADVKARWLAMREQPCDSVGRLNVVRSELELAISGRCARRCPYPAVAALVNLGPEPFFDGGHGAKYTHWPVFTQA